MMTNVSILLGELKEFRNNAMKEIRELRLDTQELRKEVRALSLFKAKLLGAAGLAAIFATLIIDFLRH